MMQILCGSRRRTRSASSSMERQLPFPTALSSRTLTAGTRLDNAIKAALTCPGRRKVPISQLLSWTLVLLGGVEHGEVVFQPTVEEASVPKQFQLAPAIFSYELEGVTATPRYTVSRLRFASPIVTPDLENNVVHGEFFCPVGFVGKRPGVVVL